MVKPPFQDDTDQNEKISSQEWAQIVFKDPFKCLSQDTETNIQDQIINKLLKFMQKTKFVPKNPTDLEKQVKKSIKLSGVQFGESGGKEDLEKLT